MANKLKPRTLKEEFEARTPSEIPTRLVEDITNWWLSKIEEVIDDIPNYIGDTFTDELKQQLRSKYLGK